MVKTRCRPNGTQPYWPAVQCRPPDRPTRARLPAAFPRRVPSRPAGPHAGSVTDDDRRQRAKQHWPIRRASNKWTQIAENFSLTFTATIATLHTQRARFPYRVVKQNNANILLCFSGVTSSRPLMLPRIATTNSVPDACRQTIVVFHRKKTLRKQQRYSTAKQTQTDAR